VAPHPDIANARLAAIVESSDDAIVGKDLAGIITDWNPAATRLFGYTPEEVVGRHISVLAIPGREGEMREILARITAGQRVEHYETQRRRKDGTIIDVSLRVSPIRDAEGRIVGASKIARDVTEKRRADERLRLLMSELDHRAKNVLAVAQAMLRLTRADNLPDFIAAVEGRIRALSRVHSQVAENRWEGAELRTLVASNLETFADRDRAVQDGPLVWLKPAAAQVIGILLHELATNAAKHGALSSEQGLVEVRWAVDPESGDLELAWEERQGPPVEKPTRRSFGSQVIERNVPDQLGGHANIDWRPLGLQCRFVVPASHIVEAPSGDAQARRQFA